VSEVDNVISGCTQCKSCQAGCPFLSQLDLTPKDIVDWFVEGQDVVEAVYSCALCGLCKFTCPNGLNPAEAFLEMRKTLVNLKKGPLTAHRPIYTYKKLNIYTLYKDKYREKSMLSIKDVYKCGSKDKFDYVFFPGCALSTFAPGIVEKTLDLLNSKFGSVGLFLECCGRPLEELGLTEKFSENISLLKTNLDKMGSPMIITSCPLCFHTLKRNLTGHQVNSVYELLKDQKFKLKVSGNVALRDSCPFRYYPDQLDNVREIFSLNNVDLTDLEFNGVKTVCCGAGGGIAWVSPDISKSFSELVVSDIKKRNIKTLVTYCETCALTLAPVASVHGINVFHILDLITGHKQDYLGVCQKIQSLDLSTLYADKR
jgi:Fe-S oxidoreductase